MRHAVSSPPEQLLRAMLLQAFVDPLGAAADGADQLQSAICCSGGSLGSASVPRSGTSLPYPRTASGGSKPMSRAGSVSAGVIA